jgi:hypothetical protein
MHSWSIEAVISGAAYGAGREPIAAVRIDRSKQDLLNAVDLLGDVLDSRRRIVDKREVAAALVAGMAPITPFGSGLQHVLLVALQRRQQPDDSCFAAVDTSKKGVAGRLSRELFVLRDRLAAGAEIDLFEFVDMACLVRCMCLARKQGWMAW